MKKNSVLQHRDWIFHGKRVSWFKVPVLFTDFIIYAKSY